MTPDLIAGRYRVVRAVGRGGMGTVWLCQDEILGREVAVKQIGMLPGESAPDAARALREARSSAALNHKNVVSIFDVVDPGDGDDGHAWLVMEYVPSRTLGEMTKQEGPLDPRRAAGIGAQVADGLAAAHAAGTIHRDVKPGNILVGEGDMAKITDFGIARRAGDDQLTRTGLVTGTPSYFSPELARGEDPGPESDVYALGATLYGAVEGRSPYPEHRNPIALLQTIASQEPPAPTKAGPLAGPIRRMMERDVATRWSMAEAAAALHRVAEEGTAEPSEETAAFTAPTAVVPPAALAAPAAAAADEPRGGWDDEPWRDASTGSGSVGAADADEDRRRGRMAPWLGAAAVLLLVILGIGFMAWNNEPGEGDTVAGSADETPTAAKEPKPSRSPSRSPSPSPTRTADDDDERQQSSPTPTPTPTQRPAGDRQGGSTGQMESAVTEYFSLVPEDTDAGWERLAPSMQAQGRDAYEGWWDSIDAVELHSAEATGGDEVRIDLTYLFEDGSATRETQLVTLQQSGGRYLIADDEVLSSRSA